jgi:iron complex transport system ATP-binding protein
MALLARLDRTVVMTTHELPFDTDFFTRVVLLAHGRIVAEGRPEDVLSSEHIAAAWGVPVELRSIRAATTLAGNSRFFHDFSQTPLS